MEDKKFVVLRKQPCGNCGYELRAYLAASEEAKEAGFKGLVKIKCPCCGKYNLL